MILRKEIHAAPDEFVDLHMGATHPVGLLEDRPGGLGLAPAVWRPPGAAARTLRHKGCAVPGVTNSSVQSRPVVKRMNSRAISLISPSRGWLKDRNWSAMVPSAAAFSIKVLIAMSAVISRAFSAARLSAQTPSTSSRSKALPET